MKALNSQPSTLNSAAITPTWFDTPERRSMLLACVFPWEGRPHAGEGTPFAANSEAPGRDGGVDCIHLLRAIFVALGVIPGIAIPRQIMDHGQHSDRSLLVEAFETWPELKARFTCVFRRDPIVEILSTVTGVDLQRKAFDAESRSVVSALLPGDVLCFVNGKVPHHGGVLLKGDWFLHALKPDGVHRMQLGAELRGWRILGQLGAVYRAKPEASP